MSNYLAEARLKGETKYRQAVMLDNYFGPHQYGVHFEGTSNDCVYPVEMCEIKKNGCQACRMCNKKIEERKAKMMFFGD